MMRCVAVLAGMVACMLAGNAAAQVPMMGNLPSFDSAPPAPPPGVGPQPGMGAPPPPPRAAAPGPQGAAQGPPCFQEFVPLREAAEKRAGMIKAATDRNAPRPEVCKLFKDFAVAEAKVVKFVSEKQSACQIPDQAVSQMKANHDRTVKTRDVVCSAGPAGAGPAGPPPGPRLSDELGLRGVAGPSNTTPGRGTFDTLSGSALSR